MPQEITAFLETQTGATDFAYNRQQLGLSPDNEHLKAFL
jgi:hypothetical protein